MYLKIPNYSYSDYLPFLEHVFTQAITRLNEAGWSSIRPPVLHKPLTEPHSTQSREWVRAEFPDPNLARIFYYTMRSRVVVSHKSPFTLEVWNPTIGAEVLNAERTQRLSIIASNPIRKFTPRMALDILLAGPRDDILALLNSSNATSSASSVEMIYTDFALNATQAIEEEQQDGMDL